MSTSREKLKNLKNWLKQKKIMRPVIWLYHLKSQITYKYQRWKRYKKGKNLLNNLIKNKPNNEVYFVLLPAIGDTLYGLSNLEAFHEKYPDKIIHVFGSDRYTRLIKSFNNIDRLTLIPAHKYEGFRRFMEFEELTFSGLSHGIVNMHVYRYYDTYKKISLDDDFRAFHIFRKTFGFSDDSPITYHSLKCGAVHSIKNFDAIKKRTVIINPYSTSMRTTMKIYEVICDRLKAMGYEVFTNVVKEQKAVKGSKPLRCSIYELYSIACEIPFVVSVQSGFLDLLIPSGVSMFAICDRATDFLKDIYKLDSWRGKNKIQEVFIENDEDINSIPEKFSAFLDELRKEGRIS